MSDHDNEVVAEGIAESIGARIQVFERDGEFHVSMETDDQGVSGSGVSRVAAFRNLVRSANEVGWQAPEAIA